MKATVKLIIPPALQYNIQTHIYIFKTCPQKLKNKLNNIKLVVMFFLNFTIQEW